MSDNDEKKNKIVFSSTEPTESTSQVLQDTYNEQITKSSVANTELMMNLIKTASGTASKGKKPPRLSFTENPATKEYYSGIYKFKSSLLPSAVIKQTRVQNLLVAAILRARGNTLSMFGHLKKDRFDIGITVDIKPEFKNIIDSEQVAKINRRIDKFTNILLNCGHIDGLDEEEKMTLPEFFNIQTMNGLSFGWHTTEIVRDENGKFNRFRPNDAGTIYKTVKKGEKADEIRRSSIKTLESLTGESIKLDPKKFAEDEYDYVQVLDGTPRQAFAKDEIIVYNLFPCSDVELNGYPLSPLDTVVSSLTTFLSIETYNRLYFQNGRAAKGMVVIKSDEIDQSVIEDVKQQFQASINNVSNSFRTPIFGIAKEDDVSWLQTTEARKDGEFQFLYEQTARNILSAFNIAPEEVPGFAHLSKGTNNQGLSESNSEFKLTASRDGGLRPLILKFQDFLNQKIFTIIDPELAQLCVIELSGLDAESKQQESARLSQDLNIHYDYDTLMEEVDKQEIGEHMGGKIPFNSNIRQIMDSYIPVSEISGELLDCPALFFDPVLQYMRDPFFYQNMQQLAQFNPNAVKAYYASRSDSLELMQEFLQDYLDEEEDK